VDIGKRGLASRQIAVRSGVVDYGCGFEPKLPDFHLTGGGMRSVALNGHHFTGIEVNIGGPTAVSAVTILEGPNGDG
jgi:hypothetical protein